MAASVARSNPRHATAHKATAELPSPQSGISDTPGPEHGALKSCNVSKTAMPKAATPARNTDSLACQGPDATSAIPDARTINAPAAAIVYPSPKSVMPLTSKPSASRLAGAGGTQKLPLHERSSGGNSYLTHDRNESTMRITPPRAQAANSTRSSIAQALQVTSSPQLKRDIPVFLGRVRVGLVLEHLEGADDFGAGLARVDAVVSVRVRVARSDWWPSRMVVSMILTVMPPRIRCVVVVSLAAWKAEAATIRRGSARRSTRAPPTMQVGCQCPGFRTSESSAVCNAGQWRKSKRQPLLCLLLLSVASGHELARQSPGEASLRPQGSPGNHRRTGSTRRVDRL